METTPQAAKQRNKHVKDSAIRLALAACPLECSHEGSSQVAAIVSSIAGRIQK
jgi:hypothetical protein